ncbi:uncharacterized protein TNCV_645281 [Trichonephila clavipes]|nr:uncharacterized protein TNCV_645281 [Trichonephila clavipes]
MRGMVDADSSISRRSEYQSNSSEWSRSRLDQSQVFRSSESGERQVEKRKKTSVARNKSGRREQWVNKRKRTSGSNESPIGLGQQQYIKRIQEVRRCKRKVPSSLSEEPYRKRRPPIREAHKRELMSSNVSTERVKKRGRKMKENFGQVPTKDSRPGQEEERSLQSSRIQQGRSSPYHLRSRGDITRKAGSRPSGRLVQAQEGPVQSRRDQFRRPSPYHFRYHRQSRQGRQEPEESLRSRRSTSLEVHIGDIAERR